jgi:Fur family peroxide stress response transcriptional regulator
MNNDPFPESAIIQALRKKGYRATSQRIAISKFALSSREHPSARIIYRKIRQAHPTVSLATVYKTLEVLKELGLVQELSFPDTEAKFDPHMKPHLNMICAKCGNVQDSEDRSAETIVNAARRAKFIVTGLRIDVYGLCSKCTR